MESEMRICEKWSKKTRVNVVNSTSFEWSDLKFTVYTYKQYIYYSESRSTRQTLHDWNIKDIVVVYVQLHATTASVHSKTRNLYWRSYQKYGILWLFLVFNWKFRVDTEFKRSMRW